MFIFEDISSAEEECSHASGVGSIVVFGGFDWVERKTVDVLVHAAPQTTWKPEGRQRKLQRTLEHGELKT
jgi:hypothetical protein